MKTGAARKAPAKRSPAGEAKKTAKKTGIKQSTLKKTGAARKAPVKRSPGVTQTGKQAATGQAPKTTSARQGTARAPKATAFGRTKPVSATPRSAKRTTKDSTTIGLIGAGHIGSQLARLATANGYKVVISNSRAPDSLSGLVAELGTRARAATAVEAAKAGDIVVVTIPLKNYRQVPVEPLAGKIVIDTNNYYPQRDGHIAELENESTTTSELLQAHLPRAC